MQDLEVFISTHWQLAYSFAAVLTLLAIVELLRAKRGSNRVNTAQAVQLINREHAVVVDTRSAEAFRGGHVIDALSIPAAELSTSKKIEKFKSKPIILVSSTDMEAQKTAASLIKEGYNSYALSGGIASWKEAGLPLIKG